MDDPYTALSNKIRHIYDLHPFKAIIFEEPEKTWDRIRNTYRTIFKDLVMGDLPDEKELIAILWKIGKRMESIDWRL